MSVVVVCTMLSAGDAGQDRSACVGLILVSRRSCLVAKMLADLVFPGGH